MLIPSTCMQVVDSQSFVLGSHHLYHLLVIGTKVHPYALANSTSSTHYPPTRLLPPKHRRRRQPQLECGRGGCATGIGGRDIFWGDNGTDGRTGGLPGIHPSIHHTRVASARAPSEGGFCPFRGTNVCSAMMMTMTMGDEDDRRGACKAVVCGMSGGCVACESGDVVRDGWTDDVRIHIHAGGLGRVYKNPEGFLHQSILERARPDQITLILTHQDQIPS